MPFSRLKGIPARNVDVDFVNIFIFRMYLKQDKHELMFDILAFKQCARKRVHQVKKRKM